MNNDQSLATTNTPSKIIQQAQALAGDIQLLSGNMLNIDDAMLLGSMFQSGYFKNVDSLSKTVTRAAFGKRIGIDVMTAVTSLYIIDGKPALEAQAIRNACVLAGYDIPTKKLDYDECILEWHYKGKLLGESKFTKVDAIRMGFIDPTCAKWPDEHNLREITVWKWDKQLGRKAPVKQQGCECKDNWMKVPLPMLLARATTLGSRMYGNHALKQEVYDIEELQDSNIRPDTTPVDATLANINAAKTVDDLQAITSEIPSEVLHEVLPQINAKTKELLSNEQPTEADSSRRTAA